MASDKVSLVVALEVNESSDKDTESPSGNKFDPPVLQPQLQQLEWMGQPLLKHEVLEESRKVKEMKVKERKELLMVQEFCLRIHLHKPVSM